ncbi:MAG TPA: polymorphic toxin-type HINT domain-containing protein [Ktedonobacteraceae bacterium]|nr:polymorphic toxin-type HINT domain-containing protein [Ktedonobacteraceae bacterium]
MAGPEAGLADAVLHTNERHPFLTQEQGFLPVSQLKAGMHILRADGSVGVVSNITVVPGSQVMYNLTVAHDHTYVVGTGQWIVHNCGAANEFKGWIQHDVYNQIRNKYGLQGIAKFVNAMNKGFVADEGSNGVKVLTSDIFSRQYEIKVKGFLGNWRIFGYYDENSGFYIFDLFRPGKH